MKQTGFYPRVQVDTGPSPAVGQAGAVLLIDTIRVSGLDVARAAALGPRRKPTAVHHPAKIMLDLAVALAVGGDCLADVAVIRSEPGLFGQIASDATVSRLVDTLAGDVTSALSAIDTARAAARAEVWRLAGDQAPDHDIDAASPLIIDLDATLVTSHSDKERARAHLQTRLRVSPVVRVPRPRRWGPGSRCRSCSGRATPAPTPLPITYRHPGSAEAAARVSGRDPARPHSVGPGRRGRLTHTYLDWLTGQRLSYSVGFGLPAEVADVLDAIPEPLWTPAYDAHDQIRDGAWVAELTGLLDLKTWPGGMRVIARKERPHPSAQLR